MVKVMEPAQRQILKPQAADSKKNIERRIFVLRGQPKEITEGFWPIFRRRLYTLTLLPLVLPAVFIVRVLAPLVLIRFAALFSGRIGHFIINTELYLCKRDASGHRPQTFDIFYYNAPICNYQLKKMWERVLSVSPLSRLACLVDRANRLLPGYAKHVIPIEDDRDFSGYYGRFPAHLAFSGREERFGELALKNLGIACGKPFVCFHCRDSVYLNAVNPVYDWRYHSFRDSRIGNYIPAMEELARRGIFTLRMGAKVKEPLACVNPMIIDYALKYRTDFMDIYLGAKCRFFVSSGSGIDEVPKAFRRQVAYVNFIPLDYAPFEKSIVLFITKKLMLRREKRFMGFGEILDSGIGGFLRLEEYERLGIDVIENTAEEILSVVIEMEERLKGSWVETEEDRLLQRRFWSLYKPGKLPQQVYSRVGADFLRQNKALLE